MEPSTGAPRDDAATYARPVPPRSWFAPSALALAACGGAAGAPAPALDHAAPAGTPADAPGDRVYAFDGAEIVGLYCAVGGALTADGCAWPATLTIPTFHPHTLRLDVHERRQYDDSVVVVSGYGAPAMADTFAVIVETAHGVSAWRLPRIHLGEDVYAIIGPSAQELDGAGVPTFAIDVPPGPAHELVVTRGGQTWSTSAPSHEEPIGFAAIDLDRDGVPEAIAHARDDAGWYTFVTELGDGDGFHVRSGG